MSNLLAVIPPQMFEQVRDRIAEILSAELINQYDLSSNPIFNIPVHIERTTPFDESELPAIIVGLDNGTYDNEDVRQADGLYTYYIDIHSLSPTNEDNGGDVRSMLNVQKLLGACRAILMNPHYTSLAFGNNTICDSRVKGIMIPDTRATADVNSITAGRLTMQVKVPETVELMDFVPLGSISTHVKLYDTDKGYFWGPVNYPGLFIEEVTTNGVDYFITENDFGMGRVKFSQLDEAPDLSSASNIVGIYDNGDGTYTNYLYTYAQLAALAQGASKKTITVATTGFTLTDVFFSNTISYIVANSQVYIAGVDFTQSGTTLTGTVISFYTGQVIIAFI